MQCTPAFLTAFSVEENLALERRHSLGKGSLVVLDYMPPDMRATYEQRQKTLRGAIHSSGILHANLDHIAPPESDLLLLLYNYR